MPNPNLSELAAILTPSAPAYYYSELLKAYTAPNLHDPLTTQEIVLLLCYNFLTWNCGASSWEATQLIPVLKGFCKKVADEIDKHRSDWENGRDAPSISSPALIVLDKAVLTFTGGTGFYSLTGAEFTANPIRSPKLVYQFMVVPAYMEVYAEHEAKSSTAETTC